MSWTDSLEHYVENVGVYLEVRGCTPVQVARTQEVCRNFAIFLEKDIRFATEEDYARYRQLRTQPQEEMALYDSMLEDIKKCCRMSQLELRKLYALRDFDRSQRGVDDANAQSFGHASFDAENSGAPSINGNDSHLFWRHQKATVEAVDILNNETFAPFMSVEPKSTHEDSPAHADSTPVPSNMQKSVIDQMLALDDDEAILNLSQQGQKKARRNSISENFNQFDFSLNDVSGVFSDAQSSSGASTEKSTAHSTPVVGLDAVSVLDSVRQGADSHNLNTPLPMRPGQTPLPTPSLSTPSSLGHASLSQNISGVQYDFSNAKVMESRESKREPSPTAITQSKPEKTAEAHFKPYLFEDLYTIDIPLPEPDDYVPNKPASSSYYFLTLLPTILVTLLTAVATFIFGPFCSLGFILTLLLVVAALPDFRSGSHLTPATTVCDYFVFSHRRCVASANKLLAMPKNGAPIVLPAAWNGSIGSFPKTMINRFKSPRQPQLRTVAGSEAQKSMIFLCVSKQNYWIIPAVQIDGFWYVARPELAPHTVEK